MSRPLLSPFSPSLSLASHEADLEPVPMHLRSPEQRIHMLSSLSLTNMPCLRRDSPNPAPLEKAKLLELLTNAFHGTRPQ